MMVQVEYSVAKIVFGFLGGVGRWRAMPLQIAHGLTGARGRRKNAQLAMAVADGRGVLDPKETLRLAGDHESIWHSVVLEETRSATIVS